MHSGVFNVPHEFRSVEVGLADECLPVEEGHSAAAKQIATFPSDRNVGLTLKS